MTHRSSRSPSQSHVTAATNFRGRAGEPAPAAFPLSTMKQCRKCMMGKESFYFSPDAGKRDGLKSWCRACLRTKRSQISDQERERKKRWRKNNPQIVRASDLAWKKNNLEVVRRMRRAWVDSDPGRAKTKWRNDRARKKKGEGFHTIAETKAIFEKQSGICVYCRTALDDSAHLDHIIPLSRGGSNWPHNLQWLCAPCNLRKGSKEPDAFLREVEAGGFHRATLPVGGLDRPTLAVASLISHLASRRGGPERLFDEQRAAVAGARLAHALVKEGLELVEEGLERVGRRG